MKTKLSRSLTTKRNKKRAVRYGLLVGNIAVVGIATLFVLHNPNSQAVSRNIAKVSDTQAMNPLDALSAADIAVSAARMTDLAEATSVKNQADSVAAELNTHVVDYAVVPKPQILSSIIKTKADIKDYTVVDGDTLGDLASRFGVTSDSLKWSNGLTTSILRPGTALVIPPIDGIAYTVKSGDTPDSLATKYSANKEQIVAFNDAEVLGIKVGERIVIPGGSIAPPPVVAPRYFTGYSLSTVARYGGNGYDYGWCTWYVSNRRAELGRPVPNNLGNAYSWYTVAVRSGLSTGNSPQPGAVAVNQGGNHVMVVEVVNDDGSFWVSEMNFSAGGQVSMTDSRPTGGWGRIDWRLVGSSGSWKYIY